MELIIEFMYYVVSTLDSMEICEKTQTFTVNGMGWVGGAGRHCMGGTAPNGELLTYKLANTADKAAGRNAGNAEGHDAGEDAVGAHASDAVDAAGQCDALQRDWYIITIGRGRLCDNESWRIGSARHVVACT